MAARQPAAVSSDDGSLAALLEQIVEAAPDPIWVKDRAGRYVIVNSAAARAIGRPREQILGRTNDEALTAAMASRANAEDRRIFENGASINAEIEISDEDTGERRVFLGRKVALRSADGRITGVLGLGRDITDRKRYEKMLVAREAKSARTARELQTLADNIPTLCFMAFADGHIYWFNRRCYDYTGRSWDSATSWDELIDPAVLPEASERWSRSVRTGEPFEMTVPVRGIDGIYRLFLTRIVPIRNEAGAIVRWFGSNTDVTELKAAEAARERLGSIIQSTPDIVGTFDRGFRITYLNPAARRLAGLAPEAPLGGQTLALFHAPEQARRLRDEILPAIHRTGIWTGETVLQRGDGLPIPASQVIVAHRNDRGEIDFYSFVARDMSERVAAEDREKLLAREVDHRAKNLLAVVQAVVQLTRAENVSDFKDAITGRVQSLARAHSLLAAARWEGVELGALIREEMAPFARDDSLRVRLNGPTLVLKPAAAQAIALVLHELATNTVKYGALSREEGRLSIEWRCTIRDGVPHLALVWDEQGGPAVGPPSHRSFGSTVIRNSVERQLKGSVALDWRESGLCCTLTLPADQIATKPLSGERGRSSGAAHSARDDRRDTGLVGRKVLLVEDEALIAAQVEAVLDGAGATVIGPAADVAEALSLAAEMHPDIAVLDVNLAGERSDPIADLLSARGIPFLFCTGYAGGIASERHRGARVLKKPLDPAELLRAIDQLTA